MPKPMGLHLHSRRANDQAERYLKAVRPPVGLWLDDAVDEGLVRMARSLGTRTILRVYIPVSEQTWDRPAMDAYHAKVEAAMDRWPFFDAYVVAYNESGQRPPELAIKAAMDIRGMKLADARRKTAVIGQFSTGTPEPQDWAIYLPALQHADLRGHWVGKHEYGGGPAGMLWGVGENQPNARVDDPCPGLRLPGWWCLRYRRDLLEWARLGLTGGPRIVMTEAGIDKVDPCPAETPGYKLARGTHPPAIGDYAQQWAWYCRQLDADPRVIGAVDFGFADTSGDWGEYDLSTDGPTLDALTRAMRALPVSPAAPVMPAPQPSPAPVPRPPSAAVQPRLRVEPREGWLSLTRRALGRQPNPAEVERMKAANRDHLDVHPGDWVLSPFHVVELRP